MGCNNCRNTPCMCSTPLVPQPFYAQASSCPEDHTRNVYVTRSAIGLQIQGGWNIPGCGLASVVSVPGIVSFPVGEYIHNVNYGFFQVVSFDPLTETMGIINPCFTDNKTPGTEVPSCVVFSVSPEPCCGDVGQDGVFVAFDFIAPEDGDCIDIQLTALTGLVVGNNVQIGSGIYFLQEVKANNIVTICNQGEGIVPGTPVIAQNAFGQYQYPVTSIQVAPVNPCTQTGVSSGKVLVCSGEGSTTLTGTTTNDILYLVDGATEVAAYQSINALIRTKCVNQAVYYDVPLQQFSFTPSVTDGVSENDLGVIKLIDNATLRFIGCLEGFEAIVNILTVCDMVTSFIEGGDDAAYASPYQHEAALHWDEDTLPYEAKQVWNHYAEDYFVNPIPGAANSIQKSFGIPTGSFSFMAYQAFQLNCFVGVNADTIVGDIHLRLKYRTATGVVYTPPSTGEIKVIVYGIVRSLRGTP